MTAAGNLRGAALMSLCMAAFVGNDACMRVIAGELPLAQVTFLRGCLSSLILGTVFLCLRSRGGWPAPRDRRIIGIRGLAEVATGVAVLVALTHLELGTFTAILQCAPLSVALAGALFFGAPIGRRRLIAILVGFVGVMIIIRPGTDAFNAWSLVALLAVVLLTVRDLSARKVSAAVSPVLTAWGGALVVAVVSAIWCLFIQWQPIELRTGLIIIASSFFLSLAYLTAVWAIRTGEISFVAPFRYTGILWALLVGVFLLGERPDMWIFVGVAIVVASGGYSLWRELQARAAQRS